MPLFNFLGSLHLENLIGGLAGGLLAALTGLGNLLSSL